MKRLKPILFLLLAAGSLAACTASFTYNRLDWLIPWYVDGYVDLDREQRRLLRQQLAPPLEWHREEELARYVALLDRIEADLADTDANANAIADASMVRSWVDEVLEAAMRVERSMMSVALEFGGNISDEQMREFVGSLRERQREYEDEFLERSDAEYADDTCENLTDLLERFLGRLSPGQQAALRQASDRLQRFDAPWLEERRKQLDSRMRRRRGRGKGGGVRPAGSPAEAEAAHRVDDVGMGMAETADCRPAAHVQVAFALVVADVHTLCRDGFWIDNCGGAIQDRCHGWPASLHRPDGHRK